MKYLICLAVLICWLNFLSAQKNKNQNLVYVDKHGVLRFTKTKSEAAFFGVNYTTPFAYGYRSHKALGVDLEKAIDQDVYHLARLGIDAFRVHVWDTEITDSLGNLLENEHLRLYDYLLSKLEERDIKIILTPIAFWGNGYPERDEKTPGFSRVYGKQKALVTEEAIKAQENYLKQILEHVNPYTKQTYGDDPYVIALEINNEPHHSGPKEKTIEYINRTVAAAKNTGWTKPIFYNISESPSYADAVAKSNIDGVSFQWYPTGLVANRTLKGNYLCNVDYYRIPFGDTIPLYRNKARMVYEFDAGDVLQSYMYPAMARSFRTAGFQWATQFAYDPMATAYGNTEYQTHYLNLAYTPSKAISLLIASKVFHKVPRLKSYGTYPGNSVFDIFRVSYKEDLSEMNSEEEFYYSNSTKTKPVNISKLQHIAGVGSSPVVTYTGYGAYFLDKLENGVWRLEVMPDAIHIKDPFERASPKKEVTRIQWQRQLISINLPDLVSGCSIQGLNTGNEYSVTPVADNFHIEPGAYILKAMNENAKRWSGNNKSGMLQLDEFFAPTPISSEPFVNHDPYPEVSANKSFTINATIVGLDSLSKVSVELRNTSSKWKTAPLQKISAYNYQAEVPADMIIPGLLNYRIIIQKANDFFVFPGNHRGNPYAWDNYINETWQTYVASENTSIELFNPSTDRNKIMLYNPDWRNNSIQYVSGDKSAQLILKATMNNPKPGQRMGWQFYFGDKISGRKSDLGSFEKLIVRARSTDPEPAKIKLALITSLGAAFATTFMVNNNFQDIEIPLEALKQDSMLLLPRPYPGFLPLWFKSSANEKLKIEDAEKLEISFGSANANVLNSLGIELESILLKKRK